MIPITFNELKTTILTTHTHTHTHHDQGGFWHRQLGFGPRAPWAGQVTTAFFCFAPPAHLSSQCPASPPHWPPSASAQPLLPILISHLEAGNGGNLGEGAAEPIDLSGESNSPTKLRESNKLLTVGSS